MCIKIYGQQLIGELLTCTREPANAVDRHAVVVLREKPYDRRCDEHSGISRNGMCLNLCSERGKIIDLNIHLENVSL